MEGYHWRLVHPEAGWVIVWLCGVCRAPAGSWAPVALRAAHPGGFLRHGTVEPAAGDLRRFGARAGDVPRVTVRRFYLRVWALFFVEYLLMPVAVLAGPGWADA